MAVKMTIKIIQEELIAYMYLQKNSLICQINTVCGTSEPILTSFAITDSLMNVKRRQTFKFNNSIKNVWKGGFNKLLLVSIFGNGRVF